MRDDDFDLWRHNYLADIMKMDFTPGTCCHLTTLHDDWCAIYEGGYCDCNPEIIRSPMEVDP